MLGVAMIAMLSMAHSAFAAQSCPSTSTSPIFASFGDTAGYVPVPGGSFEANTSWKWALTNASLVAGNEPWQVGSLNDTQSLNINPGGTAVSAQVCVDATRPTWRFFAHSTNNLSKTTLTVSLQYVSSTGSTVTLPVGTLSGAGYTSWQVTPILAAGTLLPTGTGAVQANIVFAAGSGGSWQIDDAYVDPYRVA
jgi:hypothetical protein